MESLERVLREHPFLVGLHEDHVKLLTGCAQNLRFAPGELLLREGSEEPTLFLVRQGTVALEAHRPGSPPSCVETLGPGDALGVSWVLGAQGPQAAAAALDARAAAGNARRLRPPRQRAHLQPGDRSGGPRIARDDRRLSRCFGDKSHELNRRSRGTQRLLRDLCALLFNKGSFS